MKTVVIFIALVCLVSTKLQQEVDKLSQNYKDDGDFSSAHYLKLTADEKMSKLWNKIKSDQTPMEFYDKLSIAGMLMPWYDLKPTFEHIADEMPEGRKKLIHTVGTIAMAEFVSTSDHPYTGDLSGSQHLLIRFSLAKQPDYSKKTAEGALGNFAPGISLKFLRSGRQAGNLIAMFSITGQASWNFFRNDFTNAFDAPRSPGVAEKLLAAKFSSITNWGTTLGTTDLATWNEHGVKFMSPKIPYKLIFRPNPEITKKFSDNFEKDTIEQLKTLEPGLLYDVYAIENPGCHEKKIGAIVLKNKPITSRWADEKMFFQHNTSDDEDKTNGWTKYRDYYSIWSGMKEAEKAKLGDFECPFKALFK